MDAVARLREIGFARVIVLEGKAFGMQEKTILLALWTYEAEQQPAAGEAWIHPYYPASHQAYMAARAIVAEAAAAGIPLVQRDDIRLKPIMARLPGFTQGRNTLSYVEGLGSRFHVKTFTLDVELAPTIRPEEEPHGLHCGDCHRCMEACPNHAIDTEGFHMERCIRYWMMPGKPVPEDARAAMGNRLIGCDECQRCCPHNPLPMGEAGENVTLLRLLEESKTMAEELRPRIGANLTLPNRLLAQSCLIAGNSGRKELLPALGKLIDHPSEAVREHARWAVENIRKLQD